MNEVKDKGMLFNIFGIVALLTLTFISPIFEYNLGYEKLILVLFFTLFVDIMIGSMLYNLVYKLWI